MNSVVRCFVSYTVKVYRKSPFYPKWGPRFAKLLGRLTSIGKREGFIVYDLGRFRINIDLSQFIDSQLYYLGVFETETVETIEKLVCLGDAVFDIGANIGYMALVLASCVGENGKVVAIEPSTWAFDRLGKNIELNNMNQVICEHLGVGAVTEKNVKLTVPCGYRLDGKNTAVEETVDIFSLDDLVQTRGVKRIDFIKIDTDGMEGAIINGALSALERFQPKIIFELGPGNLESHNSSANKVLDALADLGYAFFHTKSLQPFDDIKEAASALNKSETMNIVAMPLKRYEQC